MQHIYKFTEKQEKRLLQEFISCVKTLNYVISTASTFRTSWKLIGWCLHALQVVDLFEFSCE